MLFSKGYSALNIVGLAAGMAVVLEKQQLRFQSELRALNAMQLAGWVPVSSLVSVAAIDPILIVAGSTRDDILIAEMQQRIRVALVLVHDAGYDLTEAPKAWWLLAAKTPKQLSEVPIPDESIYAYAILGSTWRNTDWE